MTSLTNQIPSITIQYLFQVPLKDIVPDTQDSLNQLVISSQFFPAISQAVGKRRKIHKKKYNKPCKFSLPCEQIMANIIWISKASLSKSKSKKASNKCSFQWVENRRRIYVRNSVSFAFSKIGCLVHMSYIFESYLFKESFYKLLINSIILAVGSQYNNRRALSKC